MDNLLAHDDGSEDRPMARAWYRYTIVAIHSSQSLSYFCFCRLPSTWAFMANICLITLLLVSFAVVVVLSLIPLYLSREGNDLVGDNAINGIKITTITNSPISILCFQGAR